MVLEESFKYKVKVLEMFYLFNLYLSSESNYKNKKN